MEPAAVPAVMSAVLPAVGLAEVGGLAKEEASREGWVLSGLTHAHRIQKKSPMGTSGFTSGINTPAPNHWQEDSGQEDFRKFSCPKFSYHTALAGDPDRPQISRMAQI